ncbi:UvrD-helicase domain-containing protein [Nocardia cyriacigeorgica]|uniref:DNA 3'-5' helicase n=1 Tax=Nocardia cyriacigeorgica TaxID=135487 RepID=A0A5R8N8H9_9NOCA|nr:ATP-dependent helicase [Nocardia cyriacigeorgica]MBF6094989.1 ATP-dependent helicase [Nocardia cyriacigeorgica]MBF6427462.1 ATP-dependent helicase [Nocardia cyriacigeorgica]TLF72011.1 ATP-dependent helicase [Nocardia cyriacigeorgica]
MISTEQWQAAADMILEPNAHTAATSLTGNLVVTAGPGAGKSELLAQRADFLLRTGQCRYPRRILAISFKVDAAKNLTDRTRRRCPPHLAARLDSYTFHAFAKRLIDVFRPVLTGIDALDPDYTIGPVRIPQRQIDFDSMAPLATTILERSPVARTALRHTYGFVFLDEFQDCTANQYSLLRAAFLDTDTDLIAVGDVKQRIMGWAGALDGVLKRFAEDFEAARLVLYMNFRSLPRLRRMQNAMIKVLEPTDAVEDTEILGDEGSIEIFHYRDSSEEARALARKIHSWITIDGVPAEEIAVLVAKQVGPYTESLRSELRAQQIPFRDENEFQDLAAEPIVMLVIDYLTVVAEDGKPDAYARLMDVATGWRADDEEDAQKAYSALRTLIDDTRLTYRRNSSQPLQELIDRLLDHLGDEVLSSLAPEYSQGTRLRDTIDDLCTRLTRIHGQTSDLPQTLREFTGHNSIKLMTVHKAKGLEFDNVVVLAVENELYWGDAKAERSVYFVAISRARKALCLTTAAVRPTPTEKPARWKIDRTPHREFLNYANLP